MKYMRNIILLVFIFLAMLNVGQAEITERKLPKEWRHLVEGSRFIDRFLPLPLPEVGKHHLFAAGVNMIQKGIWHGRDLKLYARFLIVQ